MLPRCTVVEVRTCTEGGTLKESHTRFYNSREQYELPQRPTPMLPVQTETPDAYAYGFSHVPLTQPENVFQVLRAGCLLPFPLSVPQFSKQRLGRHAVYCPAGLRIA